MDKIFLRDNLLMVAFDIITVVIVLLLGFKGVLSGFLKELFNFIGIIGGIFISSRIASDMGGMVDTFIKFENNDTMILVGFIVSFIFIWLIVISISNLIIKNIIIEDCKQNKIFGYIFALLKNIFIVSIILYSISNIENLKIKLENYTDGSILNPILKDLGGYIIKLPNLTVIKSIDGKK